jgi:hypothetical protein
VEFNYAQIQWEAGDVSGGVDGLWSYLYNVSPGVRCPPVIGYASSGGTNSFELNGSGVPGAFLDTNLVSGLIYTNFNSTVPGRYIFQFHNGSPMAHP